MFAYLQKLAGVLETGKLSIFSSVLLWIVSSASQSELKHKITTNSVCYSDTDLWRITCFITQLTNVRILIVNPVKQWHLISCASTLIDDMSAFSRLQPTFIGQMTFDDTRPILRLSNQGKIWNVYQIASLFLMHMRIDFRLEIWINSSKEKIVSGFGILPEV